MCDVCKAEGAIFNAVERVVLENREGNHNKQYTVSVEQENSFYRVMASWGPIGKWVKSQEKSRSGSLQVAKTFMRDLIEKKMSSRGYSRRVCSEGL